MEALNPVTLSVGSREAVSGRVLAAFEGERQGAHISFASAELLWDTLNRRRWELLSAMTGQGAMTVRAVARRTGRDLRSVEADVAKLISAGVLHRTEEGVAFPFDAVHVDFTLTAAA